MSTIKLLLGIICFAFTGSIGMLNRPVLSQDPTAAVRTKIVSLAKQEVGVREKTGNNDGLRVERYLATVQLKRGQPWCAAFISFIFTQAGFSKPRSGWSPDMFPASRITKSARPANLLGIYFPEYKRIAHVGLIVSQNGDWISSVEGNTNITGSREGDGVYLKLRHFRTIYRMSDWVAERRVVP